ncbi:MAG: adenylate/guanylate cyclase domain-containing protein, partial [Acidimicrobiales bacterium]
MGVVSWGKQVAGGSGLSATMTFLFTDIEGSTDLLTRLGDAYAELLTNHHQIIRASLVAHGGDEIDTAGDGFFAVFSSPRESLAAAIEMQRSLAAHSWPGEERVRVRMGVHTGEATKEEAVGLVGLDVHRAARIAAVGHGGQTLVSASTAAIARGSLPVGAQLRDLGRHRLKDLGEPEQIFQLEVADLPTDFGPLRSLDNPELPNNLPSLLSEFVGRTGEIENVRHLVRSSRLVTLAGAGGCGKTRLALQVAADLLDGTGGGVWLVDFSPVSNAEQVPDTVISTLGLRASGGPLLESIVHILRDQTILLVFDNCEHVVDACAKLADAIGRACPNVHLLATSLEPLGIDGEHVYRVPSLSLPKERPDGTVDLSTSDAAQLFLMRARERDATLALDDRSASLVAQLCRSLDGIPVALELAAARLTS